MRALEMRKPPGGAALGSSGSSNRQANYDAADRAVQRLLDRLEKVSETAPGSWKACCPAHPDKRPSLGITETSDGTVLLHCWTGCTALDVVQAVGLELKDLFPRPLKSVTPQERNAARREFQRRGWLSALDTVVHEATVVWIAAKRDMLQGLDEEEYTRLSLAVDRLADAKEVLSGRA